MPARRVRAAGGVARSRRRSVRSRGRRAGGARRPGHARGHGRRPSTRPGRAATRSRCGSCRATPAGGADGLGHVRRATPLRSAADPRPGPAARGIGRTGARGRRRLRSTSPHRATSPTDPQAGRRRHVPDRQIALWRGVASPSYVRASLRHRPLGAQAHEVSRIRRPVRAPDRGGSVRCPCCRAGSRSRHHSSPRSRRRSAVLPTACVVASRRAMHDPGTGTRVSHRVVPTGTAAQCAVSRRRPVCGRRREWPRRWERVFIIPVVEFHVKRRICRERRHRPSRTTNRQRRSTASATARSSAPSDGQAGHAGVSRETMNREARRKRCHSRTPDRTRRHPRSRHRRGPPGTRHPAHPVRSPPPGTPRPEPPPGTPRPEPPPGTG